MIFIANLTTFYEHTRVKDDLIFPITRKLFKDPVLASDVHNYDRDAITACLEKSKQTPLINEVLGNNILNSNITVRKLLMNLAARTPQKFDTIKSQEVINIDIQPENILEGHALRHETNDLPAAHASQQDPMHASRHAPNDLSTRHASQ